jgi:hypothetical protein
MSTITIRNVGAYGFNTTPLNGIGLSTAEATTTRTEVDQALALTDALRAAIAQARDAGVQEFKPVDSQYLTLPAGLSTALRDELFADVMGHAWAGGPVSLNQWSQAVDELEHWAGANASMLPPGAGGGTRNVRGTWYVNGEPWTLSELFTVNRVNTMAEIDRMVSDSLNVIAANNEATKALTGLMEQLFNWYGKMTDKNKMRSNLVERMGQLDPDHPIGFNQLLAYADKFIGPGSLIRKMSLTDPAGIPTWVSNSNTEYSDGDMVRYNGSESYTYEANTELQRNGASYPITWSVGRNPYAFDQANLWWRQIPGSTVPTQPLGKEDFRAMIDEVEQIVGAFAADNQVAQLRNETLFNSRSNLLEGLGTFIKGQQTTRSTLARNA